MVDGGCLSASSLTWSVDIHISKAPNKNHQVFFPLGIISQGRSRYVLLCNPSPPQPLVLLRDWAFITLRRCSEAQQAPFWLALLEQASLKWGRIHQLTAMMGSKPIRSVYQRNGQLSVVAKLTTLPIIV